MIVGVYCSGADGDTLRLDGEAYHTDCRHATHMLRGLEGACEALITLEGEPLRKASGAIEDSCDVIEAAGSTCRQSDGWDLHSPADAAGDDVAAVGENRRYSALKQ